jgi:hypothetical protein
VASVAQGDGPDHYVRGSHHEQRTLVGWLHAIEDAARALSISVTVIEIHNQSEIEQKITALRDANGGLIFPPNSFTADNRPQIIELVTRLRLPSIYHARFLCFRELGSSWNACGSGGYSAQQLTLINVKLCN